MTVTKRQSASCSRFLQHLLAVCLFMVFTANASAFVIPARTERAIRNSNTVPSASITLIKVSRLGKTATILTDATRSNYNANKRSQICYLCSKRTRLFQQGGGSSASNEGMEEESSMSDLDSNESTTSLDRILSRLTSCFPLFVLMSALVGLKAPSCLTWVNRGSLITIMLASVMMGTGMTLEKKDFTDILNKSAGSVPAGVLCQYTIMPLTAYAVGSTLLLPVSPALFLGLILVGCCPGGTASNLVSLIAGADVALSVLLTACSTVLAAFVTPVLVKLLGGSGSISISGWALCSATARVVLLPVVLGMAVNSKAPTLAKWASRFTPFCSVLLVALICGGVVANNASTLLLNNNTGAAAGTTVMMLPRIVGSVLLLHMIGFAVGYLVPKQSLGYSTKTARTISIETGMQNSALAVVLARSVGAPALASLPGALSATAHSCLGSMLAAYWRLQDGKQQEHAQEE